jgi:hypothetical protein
MTNRRHFMLTISAAGTIAGSARARVLADDAPGPTGTSLVADASKPADMSQSTDPALGATRSHRRWPAAARAIGIGGPSS